ncbi:MAG: RHS repeat-associated core domain-containing protein [Solirubrobacteraceae bacterium]
MTLALMTLALMFVLPAATLASEPSSEVAEPLGVAGAGSISSGFASPFPPVAPSVPQDPVAAAESRTAFRGLDRNAAVALATRTFHLDRPSWSTPGTEPGEHITSYLGENAAIDRLAGGRNAVVESTIPLRVNGGSGLAPTSLTLHESEGAYYVPGNPVVPVSIAKQASGGIAFPAGLSVTPVSAATPEGSALVGNHVVFANAAKDTDLIAEPRPSGAEISWQLRSQESPATQALSFHLPQGASLQWSATPGGVEVVVEGETLLLIPPPTASDANGTTVPVSYSLSGDILTTHIDLSGTVAFPVLVDPLLFYGYYGTKNGANVWSGWQATAPSGYFGAEENAGWFKIGTNPSAPVGTYGALTITAPGPGGKTGSAGITRVDLTGVQHGTAGQSRLVATINESNGPLPDYSYNGTVGAYGPLPLYEGNNLSAQPIAFCASGAGGHDGNKEGENPLCDEVNYQGHVFVLEDEITNAPQSAYNWVLMEGAQVTYRDPAGPNRVVINTAGYTGQWLKTGPTNWKIEAEDEGLGLAHFELQIPAGASPWFKQDVNCNTQNGFTGCPSTDTSEAINLSGLKGAGEFSLAPVAVDAAENISRPSASYVPLYIDQTPPVIGELTGTLGQAAGGVIGDGNYTLVFDPTDGSKSSPQSGVDTVEIKVDGQHAYTDTTTCATPKGVPAENCFGLAGSWTMNGQAYGAGPHTITVTAKDWLGNESTKTIGVSVNEAAYQPLGAGAVNLETGDYKLSPTDVSLSGGDTSLMVSRTYDSRNLTQGATGPLGPQWALSLPGSASADEWQSLIPLPEGSIAVTNAHSEQLIFSPKEGGGYTSPAGYQTEALTEPSKSPATYQITDAAGNYTQFKQPSTGAPFVPTTVVQASAAGGLNKVTYAFTKTSEGLTEPTQVLAPEPTEGACSSSLVKGCRALTFNYAASTTATGEGPSEWGDYKGRLTRVYFTAWDPAKGEMTTTTVAQYAYDKQGRLRAEWDPRISPALKTTYGYDVEGHVTAVSGPGKQPWLLQYGTVAGDSNSGRLLSTSRPSAGAPLWKGEALTNSASPTLSTPVDTGLKVSTTHGTWTGGALAYSYQWEDCNSSGKECTPIIGATNAAYTPTPSDQGHYLVAQVTASNSSGSSIAASSPSAVSEAKPTYGSSFGASGSGAGQMNWPAGMARDAKGNFWVVEGMNNRVQEFNEKGESVKTFGSAGTGNGQLKEPFGLALDSKGDVWVADTYNNRLQEFNEKGEFMKVVGSAGTGNGQFAEPVSLAFDAKGNLWVTDTTNNRVQVFNEKGEFLKAFGSKGTGAGQFQYPYALAFDSKGNVWVTDGSNNRIDVFNEKGESLKTVASTGSGNGQLRSPWGIAVDSTGTVWVGDSANFRIEAFNEKGEFLTTAGTKGTGAGQFGNYFGAGGIPSIATDNKHDLWVTDMYNARIQKWTTSSGFVGNAATHTTQTIDYTAGANAAHPNCGEHPEWANLPCQGQHAAQPESGLPSLPVTTYTYNVWDELLTTTDTAGSTTRTTTVTYDGAGRASTTTITASADTPLPKITNEYNLETGALAKQTSEGRTITRNENTLGQQTSYTDADGNTTTYEYEPEGDQRLVKTNDGKGTQTISYDATTGAVASLKDSAAGTFTAGYDAEGNLTTQSYPNGMTATYGRNPLAEATSLEYVKTTHCTSGCTWYKDVVSPSIHAQWLSQTSSLSKQTYSYDELGRLTEVQDTPTGKGCTTRTYSLDEDGNRIAATTREPGSEGKCATEGGASQTWGYDTADRLDEAGVSYDPFGNTTSLPAADAGGSALTSTYYVNNRVASQTQNGETITYQLDPDGRARETVSTGTTNSTVIAHFAAPGDSPAWTANGSNWTRYVTGIGGGLAAIQTSGATPVLQLANLHGDIIATAALSETETKLLSTSDTTEYGVPRTSTPAKYSWLGVEQRPTELPSGIIAMGARAYVPQLGRFEQTDPQPGGSTNAYAYTFDDPVNSADPSGEWTSTVSYNVEAASTGAAQSGLPESYAGPGAIEPPPVNMQIEEGFVAAARKAGTDPCLHGLHLCIAWLWKNGIDTQFHFDEVASLYITRIGTAAAAAWVVTILVAAEQPALAAAAAGAIAGLDLATERHVQKHNCIGIEIVAGVPPSVTAGYYRSKSECG